MTNKEQINRFEDIETIVSAPLNFKAKLAIGVLMPEEHYLKGFRDWVRGRLDG